MDHLPQAWPDPALHPASERMGQGHGPFPVWYTSQLIDLDMQNNFIKTGKSAVSELFSLTSKLSKMMVTHYKVLGGGGGETVLTNRKSTN